MRALALALLLLLALPALAGAADRPNVLVVVTDDQRATGTLQALPRTVRGLRERGTAYPRAFAATPQCCPARATLFAGRYAHNTGVLSNFDALRLDQTQTVQRRLREAGYRTAIIGKFLNDWPLDRPPPFFDFFAITPGGFTKTLWNVQGDRRTVRDYAADFTAAQTLRFLRSTERADATPWLAFVAPSAPHLPATPAPRHRHDRVPPLRSDPAIAEADLVDKPPFLARLGQAAPAVAPIRTRQLRSLRAVDDLMARVLGQLERAGERRDTLIVVLSDNGFLWGEHGGLVGKDLPYTASVQIPLLLSRPAARGAGPRVDDRLVSNVDVAGTILDAAAVQPPAPLDGRSLLDPAWRRDRVFLEYRGVPGAIPPWASVRTGDRQYVEYFDDDQRAVVGRELYDLSADPFQLNNLLAPGAPPPADLAAQLARDRTCSGAACP